MSVRRTLTAPAFPPINITNLVDIALTLVVVLLMISPFIEQGFEVKLPTTSPARLSAEKTIIVTVAPGRLYYLAGAPVSAEQLTASLRERIQKEPDLTVIVKGDERISYGELARVLDLIKTANVNLVGLATQSSPEEIKKKDRP